MYDFITSWYKYKSKQRKRPNGSGKIALKQIKKKPKKMINHIDYRKTQNLTQSPSRKPTTNTKSKAPLYCVVMDCDTVVKPDDLKGQNKPVLFSFPKNDDLKKLWYRVCDGFKLSLTQNIKICSKHFDPSVIIDKSGSANNDNGNNFRLRRFATPIYHTKCSNLIIDEIKRKQREIIEMELQSNSVLMSKDPISIDSSIVLNDNDNNTEDAKLSHFVDVNDDGDDDSKLSHVVDDDGDNEPKLTPVVIDDDDDDDANTDDAVEITNEDLELMIDEHKIISLGFTNEKCNKDIDTNDLHIITDNKVKSVDNNILKKINSENDLLKKSIRYSSTKKIKQSRKDKMAKINPAQNEVIDSSKNNEYKISTDLPNTIAIDNNQKSDLIKKSKMYKCQICPMKFDRSYKLKRHLFVNIHEHNVRCNSEVVTFKITEIPDSISNSLPKTISLPTPPPTISPPIPLPLPPPPSPSPPPPSPLQPPPKQVNIIAKNTNPIKILNPTAKYSLNIQPFVNPTSKFKIVDNSYKHTPENTTKSTPLMETTLTVKPSVSIAKQLQYLSKQKNLLSLEKINSFIKSGASTVKLSNVVTIKKTSITNEKNDKPIVNTISNKNECLKSNTTADHTKINSKSFRIINQSICNPTLIKPPLNQYANTISTNKTCSKTNEIVKPLISTKILKLTSLNSSLVQKSINDNVSVQHSDKIINKKETSPPPAADCIVIDDEIEIKQEPLENNYNNDMYKIQITNVETLNDGYNNDKIVPCPECSDLVFNLKDHLEFIHNKK